MPQDSVPDAPVCFHCGRSVDAPGRWSARIDGRLQPMCCAGCQAIAQSIAAAGLEDYYRHRSARANAPDELPVELQGLELYDSPELQSRYVRDAGNGQESTLLLEGLRCGACVWLLEKTLSAQAGVTEARVNYATERAVVRWDPERTRLSVLLARIAEIGYRALPFDAQQREAQVSRTSKALTRRLFVAGIGMMQVMMYAFPVYTARPGEMEWQFEQLMRWASLLLTIPVVFYSAQPFFTGALRDLRARSAGMDVPVALGIAAAFAASVWATVRGQGEVWFDSVTMFIALLLAARWLEWTARRHASRAIDALAAATPDRATRLRSDGTPESVPAIRLAPGDDILVGAGERFPVDAVLRDAGTSVDLSLLTGESRPQPRRPGDRVPGGAVNAGAAVPARVLHALGDSTLSGIERLIERASADKPRGQRAADRVAAWFVLALLLLAVAVLAAWAFVEPARALPIAISVLVVSCPCALSLATPAAQASALGLLTRRGVLIGNGNALEGIAGCTDVVFDKTGTLTTGVPSLVSVSVFGELETARAVSLAAALEEGSNHPFGRAILEAAGRPPGETARLLPGSLRAEGGSGLEGQVGAERLRLGSERFVREWVTEFPPLPDDPHADAPGSSVVWLARPGQLLARLTLRDALRDDAVPTVRALQAHGLTVHILSGDEDAAVRRIGTLLGIGDARGSATPEGKRARVRELQAAGRRVLMVGDGINDAPVLAQADASIAVGEATALARTAADAVLMRPGVAEVARLVALSRQVRAIVRQNLAWASLYNAVAIPAAAFGFIAPWVAAVGMSTSSLLVVGNALRLRWPRA